MTELLERIIGVEIPTYDILDENGAANLTRAAEVGEATLPQFETSFAGRNVGVHLGYARSGALGVSSGFLEGSAGLEGTAGITLTRGGGFLFDDINIDSTASAAFIFGLGGTLQPAPISVGNESVVEASFFFGEPSDLEGGSISLEFTLTINGGTVGVGATVPLSGVDDVVSAIEQRLLGQNFSSSMDDDYFRDVISEIFPDGSLVTFKSGRDLGGGTGVTIGAEINVTAVGSNVSGAPVTRAWGSSRAATF